MLKAQLLCTLVLNQTLKTEFGEVGKGRLHCFARQRETGQAPVLKPHVPTWAREWQVLR